MTFELFKTRISDEVGKLCPDARNILIKRVVKNNSTILYGIVIERTGSKVSPNIYLEPFYEEYLAGKPIEELANKIVEIDGNNRVCEGLSAEQFMDFNYIKDKICYKLVNTELNKELLIDIPHRSFCDCSIVYYCLLDDVRFNDDGIATTLIYNSHMEKWQTSEEMLYELAKNNYNILMGSEIQNIADIVGMNLNCEELPMYVLTNARKLFGAVSMIDDNILSAFYEKYGDFYILPSSVHEVILLPYDKAPLSDMLFETVFECNRKELEPDEMLSDSVYFYEGNCRCVSKLDKINA